MNQDIPSSVCLFLSADKLVPLDTAFSAGTEIPCSKKKVKTNDLGVFLLAFSLWDLQQKGIIELKQIKKKSFIIFQSTILTVNREKDSPASGVLENLLLEHMNGKALEVKNLVHRILKEDTPWPHKVIINAVINDAINLGLGSADEIKGSVKQFLKGFGGNVNFIPACEMIKLFTPSFDLMSNKWNQFGKDSPGLCRLLMSACRAGVNSRIMNNDDNGSD